VDCWGLDRKKTENFPREDVKGTPKKTPRLGKLYAEVQIIPVSEKDGETDQNLGSRRKRSLNKKE